MHFIEYRNLVWSDLYRISGKANTSLLLRNILLGESFKFIFWLRTCRYARKNPVLRFFLYPFAWLLFQHYTYKFGIGISIDTEIGEGFYIGHFGSIFVYPLTIIGKNCNLSPGVVLGKTNRGKNKGYPTIGDNVYIGPGAKVIGAIRIGNNVAIGANCVVTNHVPDHAVVVGVPGKVISFEGSDGYICHTEYNAMFG